MRKDQLWTSRLLGIAGLNKTDYNPDKKKMRRFTAKGLARLEETEVPVGVEVETDKGTVYVYCKYKPASYNEEKMRALAWVITSAVEANVRQGLQDLSVYDADGSFHPKLLHKLLNEYTVLFVNAGHFQETHKDFFQCSCTEHSLYLNMKILRRAYHQPLSQLKPSSGRPLGRPPGGGKPRGRGRPRGTGRSGAGAPARGRGGRHGRGRKRPASALDPDDQESMLRRVLISR